MLVSLVHMLVCVYDLRVTCLCMCARLTGVKLTPAEEEDLRRRWQHAVGPRYEVIVRLSVVRISIEIRNL